MEKLTQKSKIGKTTGSAINWLMGNNATLPKVGEGATVLHWTDRDAYEVLEVSKDYKTVIIQMYDAERIDNNGMSESQDYKYEKLIGNKIKVVWKWNGWRIEKDEVVFTKAFLAERGDRSLTKEEYKEFFDDNGNLKVIKGKTEMKKQYEPINILWGSKRKYYDYSF